MSGRTEQPAASKCFITLHYHRGANHHPLHNTEVIHNRELIYIGTFEPLPL